MRNLIPLTLAVLCVMAAPALAQDGAKPDLGGLLEKAQQLMQKIDEVVKPLLKQAEEALHEVMGIVQEWMTEIDPSEMFGEFDAQEWIERMREMFQSIPGAPGDEEDEDFLSVPIPLTV